MAYTPVPTITTGDTWSAANHNMYIRDNFAAGVPDIYTNKGDLAVGSAVDVAGRLPAGTEGQNLEADSTQTLGMKYGWGWPTIGMIILWSGSIVSIPSGWQLCNGTNGTPDLRDKFVVGAGNLYSVLASGGGTHTHTQGSTGTEATHTHLVSGNTGGPTVTANATSSAMITAPTDTHTHSISLTSTAGSSHTHANPSTDAGTTLPPYYALAYIQKLSES